MNFSPEKLFLVGIIALVVLGPNRLPQAARTAGRLLAEFRRMSASLQNEVTAAISEPRDALGQAVAEFGLDDVRASIRNTINEVVAGPSGGRPASVSTNGISGAVGPPAASAAPLEVTALDATAVEVTDVEVTDVEAAGGAPPGPAVTPPRPATRATPRPPDDPSFN